jgi:hypothetical protein
MPEASIHEDGDLLLVNRGLARWPSGKGKVGHSAQWKMPSPAGDLALPQQRE